MFDLVSYYYQIRICKTGDSGSVKQHGIGRALD